MKKFSKNTIKGFAAGVTATLLTATLIAPAAASTIKQIKVAMGDIKIYIDGDLQIPRDVTGKQVEPMIYEGTTYLPVRALTGMLTDKPVNWDAASQSVYIGEKPGAGSVQLDTLEEYNANDTSMFTGEDAIFKSLGTEYKPSNTIKFGAYGSNHIIYKLDSNYSKLKGTYLIQHDDLDCDAVHQVIISSVDSYGAETELYSKEVKAGDPPLSIEANVIGCNFVKIESKHVNGDNRHRSAMYNVSLIP